MSPAQAAPAWLAPQDLSATGQNAASPKVAIDSAGNAVTVWHRSNGTHQIVQAAVRPTGAAWQPGQDLSAHGQDGFEPQVALDPAGNAVAIWFRSNGTHTIVQAALRPAGGAWQAAQDLSVVGQSASEPQVALDPAGNAVAVWHRSNGTHTIVQAAVRPVGGAWTAPQDLSVAGQNALSPRVAIDSAGTAVAVWRRSNGTNQIVQAAVRPAGGIWGAPQDLSVAGQNALSPRVAIDSAGTAIAVWFRSNGTNSIVQAAVRPAGVAWQLPAQDLSATGQNASDPRVAMDSAGNAVALWRRSNGANTIVQAAERPAGGDWQLPAQDLSVPGRNAVAPQVAVDGGNAVAVWLRSNGTNVIVQAALRPAGSGWQLAQDVSGVGQDASEPHVTLDRAGNALAAWVRLDGANLIVQAAPYDATAPELRNVTVPAAGFARQRLTFFVDPFDTWSLTGEPVWTFGDGKSASGQTVTHTFARGGTYTVGVTQLDAAGNASSAQRLLTLRVARCFGKAATRVGSSGPDRIVGTRKADVIVALGGADRVRGRGGNDRICGGKGRDRLAGGAGNDLLNGGPGRDVCSQGGGRGRLVAC